VRSYAGSVTLFGDRSVETDGEVLADPAGDEALGTAAHDAAVIAGESGYLDPVTGLFVFTAEALQARGACCESGCRHCPYGVSR